uniref:Transmembrane protein 11, mitochondrial n=1 Tax=Phallusia mammillata TaxID=59560 RepID=A0A6F9DV72_9ASCI|nr:transmembrane protein 11, mitochondrial [Phallusia mammillata]
MNILYKVMQNILHGLLLQKDFDSMSSSDNVRKTLQNKTTVIREVYDGINSQERFEYELECALEGSVDYIVIEPTKLGEETSRWIRVGNCLHKTAVLSGLASFILPQLLPEGTPPANIYVGLPTAVLSVSCAALYGISWQFDPCCKYQVTVNSRELSQLNVQNLTNPSPVVLVHRDDKYRKTLHNCVALCAGLFAVRAVYEFWSS